MRVSFHARAVAATMDGDAKGVRIIHTGFVLHDEDVFNGIIYLLRIDTFLVGEMNLHKSPNRWQRVQKSLVPRVGGALRKRRPGTPRILKDFRIPYYEE